jgi:DNA-binding protein H-NS
MLKALEKQPVDALLKLRDDVNAVLEKKVGELQNQLTLLGRGTRIPIPGTRSHRGPSKMLGRKVAPKYQDRQGNTWAGRGMQPRWLQERLKQRGTKLEDFAVGAKGKTRRGRKPRVEMAEAPEAAE